MKRNNEYLIKFSDENRSMNVILENNTDEYGMSSEIRFKIDEVYPDVFDILRINASKTISLKEAEQLVEKLKVFIEKGKKFLF